MEEKKKYKKIKLNREDHKGMDNAVKKIKIGLGVSAGLIGICKVIKKVDNKKLAQNVKMLTSMVKK